MKGDVFILTEIEAIGPHSWLEADSCSTGIVELCKIFPPNLRSNTAIV